MERKEVYEEKKTISSDEGSSKENIESKFESDKVKRPMNAFMLWSKHERKEISQNDSTLHNAEISKLLGERWKRLSDADKQPYVEEAQKLMVIHKREHPEYRYKPRKSKLLKKIRSNHHAEFKEFENMTKEEEFQFYRQKYRNEKMQSRMVKNYFSKYEKADFCSHNFGFSSYPLMVSSDRRYPRYEIYSDNEELIRYTPYRAPTYRYSQECRCRGYSILEAPSFVSQIKERDTIQRNKLKNNFSVDSLLFKKENDIRRNNSELASSSSGDSEF